MLTKSSLANFVVVGLMAVTFIVLFKFVATKSGIAPLADVAAAV